MKTTLLWIAALCVVSAASFYGGMCRAAFLINYSRSDCLCLYSRTRIDMLKAGQTADAIALETRILDGEVGSLHRPIPLGLPSPLFIFSGLRDPEHRDLLFTARDMHAKYPDLAFRPESLVAISKFEERYPYDLSAVRR